MKIGNADGVEVDVVGKISRLNNKISLADLDIDKLKFRIGYGKGFYDNFLSLCKTNTIKVGLSFFDPVDKIVDIRSKDVRMDFCVNPEGIKKFTS